MTLLERHDGEGGSYLEIADFIQNHGARGAVEADLELSARDARRILAELRAVTGSWRRRARAARLPASEIASIEPAFVLSEETSKK